MRTAHRVYGKKIREIARETGHSRNTVKKALKEEYCGYQSRERQPYPVLGPYLDIIDRWLKGDRGNPKKQHHTARRIYNRLCHEHGFKGSERAVRKYVHDARKRLGLGVNDVFILLDPELGREAEVDWGECHAVLGGAYIKLKMFCMRSKGSGKPCEILQSRSPKGAISQGKPFVQCFPCERQQALFEGHIRAFGFMVGSFPP